ncbi:hypothetical protein KIPB_014306, partial [Kipferlia bialata]|eukprot:g14306.t1
MATWDGNMVCAACGCVARQVIDEGMGRNFDTDGE